MSEATHILKAAGHDGAKPAEDLLPLVYAELRNLAAAKMAAEAPGDTLQPTALVHEAWLKLAVGANQDWNSREHFFRAAAEAMRRILVDRARERLAAKRGQDPQRTELSDSKIPVTSPDDQVLAVHDALNQLALHDPISAELVKLRYFAGLNMAEAAASLGLAQRSAERLWTFAKTWLREQIESRGES
jgi:RNA polymerase sigma factor (TIGR02999 family)